jgi:hypothetical protein
MIRDVARRLAFYVKSQASARVEDLDSGLVRVLATDGDVRSAQWSAWPEVI